MRVNSDFSADTRTFVEKYSYPSINFRLEGIDPIDDLPETKAICKKTNLLLGILGACQVFVPTLCLMLALPLGSVSMAYAGGAALLFALLCTVPLTAFALRRWGQKRMGDVRAQTIYDDIKSVRLENKVKFDSGVHLYAKVGNFIWSAKYLRDKKIENFEQYQNHIQEEQTAREEISEIQANLNCAKLTVKVSDLADAAGLNHLGLNHPSLPDRQFTEKDLNDLFALDTSIKKFKTVTQRFLQQCSLQDGLKILERSYSDTQAKTSLQSLEG